MQLARILMFWVASCTVLFFIYDESHLRLVSLTYKMCCVLLFFYFYLKKPFKKPTIDCGVPNDFKHV